MFQRLLDILFIPTYDDPADLQAGKIRFDESKCKRCGICISVCPGGCITSDSFSKMDYMRGTAKGKGDFPRLETTCNGKIETCVACYDCGAACPHQAIEVVHGFRAGRRLRKYHQAAEFAYPKKY